MNITRGVSFRCYDVCGLEKTEVCVEDGVIVHRVPEEIKTKAQAFAIAQMFHRAACELSLNTRGDLPDDGA